VIEISTAVFEDTTRVELEVVGIDGNSDGGNSELSEEVVAVTLFNIDEVGDLVITRGLLALLVNSLVGIRSFSGNTVGFNEGESSIHKSTIATFVTVLRTINQILFGYGDKLLGRKEESTFNSTSGGESPARTALTLVLNRGNSTLSNPIDITRFSLESNVGGGGFLGL